MNTLTPQGNKLIDDMVQGFILAAVAAERERCAKICETHAVYYVGMGPTKLVPSKSGEPIGLLFAAAIRNKD